MTLPKQAIEEYKELYQKRFGVVLNDSEASLRANNLIGLYSAVLGSKPFKIEQVVGDNDVNPNI